MKTKKRVKEVVREKTTFNISIETKESLDVYWFKLKRELKGRKITKSLIVEESIKIILNDLGAKNKSSQLYRKLSS